MKKILIVEGNTAEENGSFTEAGIKTHTESLRESLKYISRDLIIDVVNPSSDKNVDSFNDKLHTFDGLIWGGSSLNIYNDTPEIKKQIEFMKNCQSKVKNILGICWGMQVAVTAAGGQVKKANTSHVGIAKEIEINEYGLKHPLYKDKVQSLYFQINKTRVWGLQYHPEITYEKMISLINFRRKRLIEYRKVFKNENDLENHISFIEKEIQVTIKEKKMLELKNWLKELN